MASNELHELLIRQLRKTGLASLCDDERLLPFLRRVSDAYRDADRDRAQLERSLELASEELDERFQRLESEMQQRSSLNQQLADDARRDKLTGLPNRRYFMEQLELSTARLRAGEQGHFAVLFLDIDRFKFVNDTRGHAAGDQLLRLIGARLSSQLGVTPSLEDGTKSRLVSRFGGDEFLVLLNDLPGGDGLREISELLLAAFTQPFGISGGDVHSNASIGIVTSEQCDRSTDEIVRKADMALYEAKRAGRGRATLFNHEMQRKLIRNAVIETDLRRAVESDELYLVFQPIIDLTSGRIVSAEALVRWQHPNLGAVSPTEFISVAEESGLIRQLGQWVQREACRTLVAWQNTAPHRAPASLSINISRAELASGDELLNQLQELLQLFQLPAQSLQLEVTEREVMRTPEEANVVLRKLKQVGIQIAMDDFGTGTSSLGVLRSFPFDTIKIDNSFVHHLSNSPDGLAVLQAAVTLIENLGMSSVAEGVETAAQLAALQALGCHRGQGYFLGKPTRAESFLDSFPDHVFPAADSPPQTW